MNLNKQELEEKEDIIKQLKSDLVFKKNRLDEHASKEEWTIKLQNIIKEKDNEFKELHNNIKKQNERIIGKR